MAEDPRTLEEAFLATNSHRMEALSAVSPVAYALEWLLYYSDASMKLTLGIVAVVGIFAGAALSALMRREFRLEGFANASDMAHHLAGGALMGVGGAVAGCTIGQGLSPVDAVAGQPDRPAAIIGGGSARLQQEGD
jgi:hypothetical protein